MSLGGGDVLKGNIGSPVCWPGAHGLCEQLPQPRVLRPEPAAPQLSAEASVEPLSQCSASRTLLLTPYYGSKVNEGPQGHLNLPLKNTTFQLVRRNMGYMSVKY